MRSAMVPILSWCRRANSSRCGRRAMLPSSFMTSHNTPTGFSPARRHRSTAASVCPARTSTPPRRERSGKMCPGRAKSPATEASSASARMVAARSADDTPVVVPARRSTDTVNAVRCCSLFSGTICGSSRRASCCSSIGTQMMPLVWRIMKAPASGGTRSAAMMRSPSFSRSSSSMMTTIRPARSSARISSMELSAGAAWGAGAPLPVSDRTLDMVRGRVVRQISIPDPRARPRAPTHCLTGRDQLCGRQRQQPRQVARYLVDFQVHARPHAQGPEGGARARVGNDVDAEARLLHRVDGETHPVHGDRALGREVTRERQGYPDGEAQGTRVAAHLQNLRNTVDVSRHQVSAERIPGPERGLEIHRRIGLQFTEGGEVQRLARYVGGERARLHRSRGQTATLHADTVADATHRQVEALRGDHQTHIAAARFTRLHPADVLNYSGKHSRSCPLSVTQ